MIYWECVPLAGGVIWIVVAFANEVRRQPPLFSVHYDAALESAKLMKDWGVWMASIATASLGFNGFTLKDSFGPLSWGHLSIAFFLLSVLLDAWLLGCLPSLIFRLYLRACHSNKRLLLMIAMQTPWRQEMIFLR